MNYALHVCDLCTNMYCKRKIRTFQNIQVLEILIYRSAINMNLTLHLLCGIMWEREVFGMFASQRQEQIQVMLKENGAVTVAGLMETFGISMETARRDLAAMEKAGLLARVHGGALPLDSAQLYRPLKERMQLQQPQKLAIARAAAELVAEDDFIAICAGSTALAFARELRKRFRRLTVVTYSLDVLNALRDLPEYTVILAGGTYLPEEGAFVGPATADLISRIYVQKAFIFPSMLSLEKGISTHTAPSPQIATLIHQCDQVYVLADNTKFEKNSLYQITPMRQNFIYITDANMPAPLRQLYEDNHLKFIYAE